MSAARIFSQFCSFSGIQEEESFDAADYILEFFRCHYLNFLEHSEHHVIYHHDQRWSITLANQSEEIVEDDEVFWEKDEHNTSHHSGRVTTWKEAITNSNMYGFDQIIALSQTSLNSYFDASFVFAQSAKTPLEHVSALSAWSYEHYFSATFKPITIRLLSEEKAILWFHLEEGHLKMLQNNMPSDE